MSDFAVKDLLVPVLPESGYTGECANTNICPTPPTGPDCAAGTHICPTPPTGPDCAAGTNICPTPPTGPGGRLDPRDDEALRALGLDLDRIIRAG